MLFSADPTKDAKIKVHTVRGVGLRFRSPSHFKPSARVHKRAVELVVTSPPYVDYNDYNDYNDYKRLRPEPRH